MNIKTWEKIKAKLKNAPPITVIRTLHPIVQDSRISTKVRNEAKDLANKARLLLDSEQWWKSGVSILPTGSRQPQLEKTVREERPTRNLEDTVEASAPIKPKEAGNLINGKYTAGGGEQYISKGYFSQTAYERETKPQEAPVGSREEATATTSEKLSGEVKTAYHRHRQESY